MPGQVLAYEFVRPLTQRIHRGTDALGYDTTEQRVRTGIVDGDWQERPRLAAIAFEHHDAITMRAAGHLYDHFVFGSIPPKFAGALDQHFDLATEELLVVFLANSIL